MKHCTRCDTIKPLADFKDHDLITGYGRYCNFCKNRRGSGAKPSNIGNKHASALTNIKCPACTALMIVRERRSDKHKFYGCSRFPKCKGTKPLI